MQSIFLTSLLALLSQKIWLDVQTFMWQQILNFSYIFYSKLHAGVIELTFSSHIKPQEALQIPHVRFWEIKTNVSHRPPQILDDPLPKQESELSQVPPFPAYYAARLMLYFFCDSHEICWPWRIRTAVLLGNCIMEVIGLPRSLQLPQLQSWALKKYFYGTSEKQVVRHTESTLTLMKIKNFTER